jgi:signal transduction histidine kinase
MAAVIYTFYRYERVQIAEDTVTVAHTISAAVDRELRDTIATAHFLAASPLIASGDFAAFYREATALLPLMFGNNFVLGEASGQELVNTLRPFGEALPFQGSPESQREVFETGLPVISDVFFGPVSRSPLIVIDVPVFIGTEVKYVLSVGVLPKNLQKLLLNQKLPSNWIVSVLDTIGVSAARTRSPELYVGKKATLSLRKAMGLANDGVLENRSIEDIPVFVAYSRSEFSNWTVAVGIPIADVSGGLNKLLLIGSAGAVILLIVGLLLAGRQSSQIARAVQDLISPAQALGRGEVPQIPQPRVQEADDVAQALVRVAELLREETNERKLAEEKIRKFSEELELRVAERTVQLKQANKDLEEFAYAASHDLKAPLRVIDNASKWLEEDLQEHLTDETRENMNLLRGRIGRMEKLLDDLLEYSRIGKTEDSRYAATVTGDVLMVNILELLSPPEGFSVTTSLSFAAIHVRRMPLQQIIMNLISNAIKHHDKKGGCVDVTVEDVGPNYVFTVRDDGPGIAPEYQDQIFKMFLTLKPRDEVEGSGMGLAMVRKNVEVFGGKLSLESAEGQGSAFRFTWPKIQRIRNEPNEYVDAA